MKTYQIQGKTFEWVKLCLEYRIKSEKLYKKYVATLREYIKDTRRELNDNSGDVIKLLNELDLKKINEIKELYENAKGTEKKRLEKEIEKFTLKIEKLTGEKGSNFNHTLTLMQELNQDIEFAKTIFLLENLKEVLTTCLEGADQIKLEVTEDEYAELEKVSQEIVNDFFLSKEKSNSYAIKS